MPFHFRDRVILYNAETNIPQLPSGRVTYSIGTYRLAPPQVNLNLSIGSSNLTQTVGTANVFDAQYTISLSTNLDGSLGAFTQAKTATSP